MKGSKLQSTNKNPLQFYKKYIYIIVCLIIFFIVFLALNINGKDFVNSLQENNSKDVSKLTLSTDLKNSSNFDDNIIDSITQVTTHAISTTTLIINALAAIMTAISLVSIVITIITATQLKDTQEKMKRIETTEKEVRGVKYTLNIISGIIYKKDGQYDYAIEEFENVINLCENDENCLMKANCELGHLYSELYTEINSDYYFEKAERYLREATINNHDVIIYAESNFALGTLYGIKAESSIGDLQFEYLKKSEEYLKYAIKIRNNPDYNKNIAVTYALMNKIDKAIKYLERAIDILEEEYYVENPQEEVLKVFKDVEKKLLGKNWNIIQNKIRRAA